MIRWIAALFAAGAAAWGVSWWWRARTRALERRSCPECSVPLVMLGPEVPPDADDLPSYQVWICPKCVHATALANGAPFEFTTCPQCKERSLETPCVRLPDEGERRRVQVHEMCTPCGHDLVIEIGDPPPRAEKRGLVLPFRRRKRTDPDATGTP